MQNNDEGAPGGAGGSAGSRKIQASRHCLICQCLRVSRPAVLIERLLNEEYGVDSSCSWPLSRMARVLPAFLGSEYTTSSLQACQALLRSLQHSCATMCICCLLPRTGKALDCAEVGLHDYCISQGPKLSFICVSMLILREAGISDIRPTGEQPYLPSGKIWDDRLPKVQAGEPNSACMGSSAFGWPSSSEYRFQKPDLSLMNMSSPEGVHRGSITDSSSPPATCSNDLKIHVCLAVAPLVNFL